MTDRTSAPSLVTVGHGRLEVDALVSLLRGAQIAVVADVRRYPGSRRHPHFAREALSASLEEAGVGYRWVADLGGRRSPAPDSRHTALRNAGFRAYADHMETAAFRAALDDVLAGAGRERTAILCAESVWWRCHRRLIADAAVLLDGFSVEHLFHDSRLRPHVPTPEVRTAGDRLVYDRSRDRSLPGL